MTGSAAIRMSGNDDDDDDYDDDDPPTVTGGKNQRGTARQKQESFQQLKFAHTAGICS
jgi:hypothetical protein